MKTLTVLGIIPARGGSKGIKNKNIVFLARKPMIAYTIEAAREARLLSRCIVTTDSELIAEVSREHGAEVPFIRPEYLARDETPTLPVIHHALDMLGESYDAVLILQPTSPFRSALDIDTAIEMMAQTPEADSVISVVRVGDNHPARMKSIRDGWLIDPPFAEQTEGQRRQDLPALYLRNGAIYLTRTSVIREQNSLKGSKSLAYVMPELRSVNIDNEIDLLFAEAVARKIAEGEK